MKPYETVEELLDDSKKHGPYITLINIQPKIQPKILKCPIEVTDEGVTIYHEHMESSEFVKYDVLKKHYTWQDGSPCGKSGD